MASSASRSGAQPPQGTSEDGGNQNQQLNYLKFFVIAANRDIADIGLSKPITVKDLDDLDQDTFIKILIYLVTSEGVYTADQMMGKSEILLKLTEAGLPRLEYDASLDYIYWAVKRLLPENDETFSYGILLHPQSNPKAVKQTIQYLMQFNVFTASCSEAFEEINSEVADEHVARTELHRQIDEMDAMIAEKTAELEERNEILPELQTKLSEVTAELAQEEDLLVQMEQEVKKYQMFYDAEEQEKLRLERTYMETVEYRMRLESRIVLNPEVLQRKHKAEKDQLETLIREREEIGERLKQLSVEDKGMEDVINKSETLLTRLKECTEIMAEVEAAAEEQKEMQDELKSLYGTLNWIVTNLKHLTLTRAKTKEKHAEELRGAKIRIKVTEKQLAVLQETYGKMMKALESKTKEQEENQESLIELSQSNKVMEERIQKNQDYLTNELPAKLDVLIKDTAALLEELNLDLETGDNEKDETKNRGA